MKNRKIKYSIVFLLVNILLFGCTIKKSPIAEYKGKCEPDDFIIVSFGSLIKNPKEYHLKAIEIEGYYSGGVEKSALFKGGNLGELQKALWIELGDSLKESTSGVDLSSTQQELHKLDNKQIIIRGIYNMQNTGHLDEYFGAVKNVCYIKIF